MTYKCRWVLVCYGLLDPRPFSTFKKKRTILKKKPLGGCYAEVYWVKLLVNTVFKLFSHLSDLKVIIQTKNSSEEAFNT